MYGQNIAGGPAKPKEGRRQAGLQLTRTRQGKGNATYALWENFLECVRGRNRETLSTPELGAAAFSTVNMGVQSYRFGKVLFWDKEQRKTKEADASWASQPGGAQQEARQAEPDHRLDGRRRRQHADPAGVPEAGRPVGRWQGPGGGVRT